MSTKSSKTPRKDPIASDAGANKMWGGRFDAGPDVLMERINASIGFDKRLFAQDIAGSKAHAAMLVARDILSADDGKAIRAGLDQVLEEIEDGRFAFKTELEDIHLNIESRLREIIGDAAGRLHTARSRNDQVATDLKLWLREVIDGLDDALKGLQEAMITRAEEHAATVMPGFTHLQAAQPVTLGHHLLAYVEMFGRDRGRFADARARLNECPLGVAALAGTSFPIDRDMTAQALGFRPADRELARHRLGPGFRDGIPGCGVDLRDPSVAAGRRDRRLVLRSIRLRQADRRVHDRQLDHAAEAQPGTRRS